MGGNYSLNLYCLTVQYVVEGEAKTYNDAFYATSIREARADARAAVKRIAPKARIISVNVS